MNKIEKALNNAVAGKRPKKPITRAGRYLQLRNRIKDVVDDGNYADFDRHTIELAIIDSLDLILWT